MPGDLRVRIFLKSNTVAMTDIWLKRFSSLENFYIFYLYILEARNSWLASEIYKRKF